MEKNILNKIINQHMKNFIITKNSIKHKTNTTDHISNITTASISREQSELNLKLDEERVNRKIERNIAQTKINTINNKNTTTSKSQNKNKINEKYAKIEKKFADYPSKDENKNKKTSNLNNRLFNTRISNENVKTEATLRGSPKKRKMIK
jgi:hypothetical protein